MNNTLTGRGRLPKERTLAELEDLFKKYEKAYKKIDMEAYAKYKKDVDVKGNWNIETKIHNYNYTKRRIDHFKKYGTDLLETKKNIVYYTKEKKKGEGSKYRGTKWEGVASQKEFLIKKVIDEEKIKKKRTKKVLTTEEKTQAKEARRVKKLDTKEKQFLEGKVELGEKLTPAQKKRLDTLNETATKEDAKKIQAKKDKAEALRVKKLDIKFEKMKAYISNAVKAIPKEEAKEEIIEEPVKPQEPISIEELLGFKAPEVVVTKPVKPIEIPKVVKQLKSKEELKKVFTKLKDIVDEVREHESHIKIIDKTRTKLAKQKGNKSLIEEIDKERDLHTKLLNNALSLEQNMKKTIHVKDLVIFRKFMKNPNYFNEEQPVKQSKTKPKTKKEAPVPIETQLRNIAFETNKELLKETLRRSGLSKIPVDAEPQQILDKFLKVNKERQENIINYYKNIMKEFDEEKEEEQPYIEKIANPNNPIFAVKPAEEIPKYIESEEEYLAKDGEEDEDEDEGEEDIFDSNAYSDYLDNAPYNHELLFREIERDFHYRDTKKAFEYLNIPIEANTDIYKRFRRPYNAEYEIRIGNIRSPTIDVKSKENKNFVKKVNEEISQMLKILFLLKNPNLI